MTLDKASLLKRKIEKRNIADGEIYIRQMSLYERDKFLDEFSKDDISSKVWRQAFIALCLVDESGKRLFDDDEKQQINDMPAETATAILNECLIVNGMNATAKEDTKKN